MTVAAELVATLDAGNLGVPVRPPGSTSGALPAVVVVPADDTVGEGGRYLVHGYDVTVMVQRGADVAQLDRLETLTTAVARVLLDAGYAIGPRLRYVSDAPEDVGYLGRVIPTAQPGEVLC